MLPIRSVVDMAIRALIFDVDGTLAETERDGHRVAFNAAFEEAGLPWHWDVELYDDLLTVTGGKERIRHFCTRFDPTFLQRRDATALIAGIHAAKTRRYGALVRTGQIKLRPGVQELIHAARDAGIRLAIATTTTPDNVTELLRTTLGEDAPGWFEVVGAGDVVPDKKPSPAVYLWVLDQLGLDAAECVAIEDSEPGLAAAAAAGVATVVAPSAHAPSPRDPGGPWEQAALVVDDLTNVTLADLAALTNPANNH